MEVTTIGLDLGKNVFQVHGIAADSTVVFNRSIRRRQLIKFFKTIKAELLWQRSWGTCRDTEFAIFEHINGFHNPRRRHSALGWKSPLAFEAKAA